MFPRLRLTFFVLFTLLFNFAVFAGTNPFLATADAVVNCPDDGSQFPSFTLCGPADTRSIQINDPLVLSAQWQLLDGNSCAAGTADCPNLGLGCSWNTVASGNSFTIDSIGEYRVILTYANSADEFFYAKSTQNAYSDVIAVTKNISVNGGTDGEITITASGNAPFIYQISNDGGFTYGPFQSSSVFTNLSVGTYQIKTRDSSGICEFLSSQVVMVEPDILVGQLIQTQVPSCIQGGEIEAIASGGLPPYQFALNGGAYTSSNIYSNLTAGSYVVEVIDSNGITTTTNGITITNHDTLGAIFTNYDISCFGEEDGRIEVQAFGGSGVYLYQLGANGNLGNSQASPIFENLAPGTYDIFVQDSGGCVSGPNTTVIAEPSALDVTVTVVDASGNGAQDGHITVNASGGAGSYQYSISPNLNEFYSSNEFDNLGVGSYIILVQDQNGCSYTTQANVNAPDIVTASVTVIEHASCTVDGAIDLSANGGVSPYEYSIDGGVLYNQMSGNPTRINGLSPGMYQIAIRDANGQIGISSAFIDHTPELTVDIISGKAITCNGDQDGRYEVGAQGGDGNYSFQLTDAQGNVIRDYQTSGVFDNLDAGEYVFNVTDTNGCIGISFVYEVREAEVFLVDNISSQGDTFMPNTGSISFEISGGAAPYSYSINSSAYVSFDETSKTITDLAAGDHILHVRDAFGCEAVFTQTVDPSESVVPITAEIVVTNLSCAGNIDGSIEISNSQGGSGEYVYAIDTIDITKAQTSTTFSGVGPGSHFVSIFDSNGYVQEFSFEVTEPAALEITSEVSYSGDTATLILSATGGTLPYSYILDGAEDQEVNFFEGLSPGDYIIQVQDANGCSIMSEVVIEEIVDQDSQNIDVFQNPGRTEVLDISFRETQSSDSSITVYNSKGNIVYSSEIEQGSSQTQIDVNNLARGIYFIYIKNAEIEEIKKVMIL